MVIDGRMDREKVLHLHNGYYSAVFKHDIMKSNSEWRELKTVILSKATHIQNRQIWFGLAYTWVLAVKLS